MPGFLTSASPCKNACLSSIAPPTPNINAKPFTDILRGAYDVTYDTWLGVGGQISACIKVLPGFLTSAGKIATQAHHPKYDALGLSRNAMLSKAVVID